MRYVVLLLIALTAPGCAAKARPVAVAAPVPVDTAPADRLFEAGCYRCLTQAFEKSTESSPLRAGAARARTGSGVRHRRPVGAP